MSKPWIKKDPWAKYRYVCDGMGVRGFGGTMRLAYENWRMRVWKRNISELVSVPRTDYGPVRVG